MEPALGQFFVFAGMALPAYVAQRWFTVGQPSTTLTQH